MISRAAILAVVPLIAAAAKAESDPRAKPIVCESCAEWNRPHAPVRLYGDSYYVGTDGLAVILIVTPKGLILIDGALPQSARIVESNLKALGFRIEDVKLILASHEHFDHVGGISALQRDSGAAVVASAEGARALELGHPLPEDPQYRPIFAYPKLGAVKRIGDGKSVTLGGVTVTAHYTPGHTPGSTTWTWRSCAGDRCADLVYGDSLTAIGTGGYRFSDEATHPGYAARFRSSIESVAALPCDLLVTTHPAASQFWERVAARAEQPNGDPVLNAGACKAYADGALANLDKRLDQEAR